MTSVHLFMLLAAFLLGGVAGFLMHRADYCLAGIFRDLFLFGAVRRLRTLLLLVAVALVLFELLHLLGLVVVPFPLFGPPSWANLLGGFLFGIGMVLAGGCVVGTLYKLGAGSFSALLAFLGLVGGSTLYAELHPWWRGVAKALALPVQSVTLPQLLGLPAWLIVLPLGLLLLLLSLQWWHQGKLSEPLVVEGYLQPWQAAVGLAVVGAGTVLLQGMPMGITTSYAKMGAALVKWLSPAHYATLVYFQAVPLHYLPPLGGGLVSGGPGYALDGIALLQFPLIGGIIVGAACSAVRLKEWRMRFSLPWRQAVSALLGGCIMGLAARMAPACNIWHLFGGLPILALQSMLFLLGLLPGAWVGGLLLTRLVMPER